VTRSYLDHASTSPPRPEALAALTDWMTRPTGDPGRLHEEGLGVRDALEQARA
jgi:cysteine desulfurase